MTKGQCPKVIAYAWKRAINMQHKPPFILVPCLDISAYHCLQVLDVVFNNETWHIVNFYHDVQNNTSLKVLLKFDEDANTPMLILGNFNTHFPTQSPPDTPQSSWARQIEEWVARNLLTLTNNPGKITCKGAENEWDSVLDLAWYNEAAVQASTFTNLMIDWEGSLGSDHACLQVTAQTWSSRAQTTPETNLGFIIDPEKKRTESNPLNTAQPCCYYPSPQLLVKWNKQQQV